MEIVEGQGRFEARKHLGLPIQFIIVPGLGRKECIHLNSNNSTWTLADFVSSAANGGNINYMLLEDMAKGLNLSINEVLLYSKKITSHGGTGRPKEASRRDIVKNGQLEFTKQDAYMVRNINAHINEIKEALQFKKKFNEAFKRGIIIVYEFPGYNKNHMVKNCSVLRSSFSQPSNLNDMLKEFERIYNYKAKKKLFFSDTVRGGSKVRKYENTAGPKPDFSDVSTLKK